MSSTPPLRLAWIIPCHNEELTIADVIAQIKEHCPEGTIYVCDNHSTDKTAEVAINAGARVLSERRMGKGYAVRTLLDAVDADIYLMTDGDMTYDIANWRRLAEPVLQGLADMSVGTRLQKFEKDSFRPLHFFGNRLITRSINLFFAGEMSDVLSGYRCFNRMFVKGTGINAKGFEIESELTIQACEHGFRVAEIQLDYVSRPDGSQSKLKTFNDGFIILYTILRLVKDNKPLTFFGSISVVSGFIGLWLALTDARFYSVVVFMFSISSFFSGIVLNAVAQRFKEIMQVIRKLAA